MSKYRNDLSSEYVNSILSYNPESWDFTWKVDRGRRWKSGKLAGSLNKSNGYRNITISGKDYKAHRLAWLLYYGLYPKNMIDHINWNRADNRIVNLREATCSQNSQNNNQKVGKSGERHITVAKYGKFQVRIKENGKLKHFGYYQTIEQAILVRDCESLRIKGDFMPKS